ncbi:uncharacterized protein BDV14DRAFT_170776 [Aspergillus stella-maris]|uniref:uncharacterized protein n=1 Tax=Aspergillus stella-maris TaxID=1810926 RepID=UPI003CCD18DF
MRSQDVLLLLLLQLSSISNFQKEHNQLKYLLQHAHLLPTPVTLFLFPPLLPSLPGFRQKDISFSRKRLARMAVLQGLKGPVKAVQCRGRISHDGVGYWYF